MGRGNEDGSAQEARVRPRGWAVPVAPRGAATWLAGTRFTLGAINLFNAEPAFVSDGFGFYNPVEDPRQRVLYLQVRKGF